MSWDEIINKTAARVGKEKNKQFKKWMTTKESIGYVFDYGMFNYLFNVVTKKLSEKSNDDQFTVVVGMEGVGKSTLASQICAVTTDTFKLENVCFSSLKVIQNMRNNKRGDCIWIDEGGLMLFSTNSQGKESKVLMQLFTVIRKKGYHFVVCIPNFKTLNNYIREHRIDCLINVTERGKYTLYKGEQIDTIITELKKGKKFSKVIKSIKKGWKGYFTKSMPELNDFSAESYDKLKDDNIDGFLMEAEEIAKQFDPVKDEGLSNLETYTGLRDVEKKIKLNRSTLVNMIKKGELTGKKVGNKWMVTEKSVKQRFFDSDYIIDRGGAANE